jgi:hypothetical protein
MCEDIIEELCRKKYGECKYEGKNRSVVCNRRDEMIYSTTLSVKSGKRSFVEIWGE